MDYTLSEHAETTISERGIKPEWIGRALDDPDLSQPHKSDPTLTHPRKRKPCTARGDKNPINIVAVYFGRAMKEKP